MKKVYKLVHKRFIEFSADTNEKVYCTKLLGFFSSTKVQGYNQLLLAKTGL